MNPCATKSPPYALFECQELKRSEGEVETHRSADAQPDGAALEDVGEAEADGRHGCGGRSIAASWM